MKIPSAIPTALLLGALFSPVFSGAGAGPLVTYGFDGLAAGTAPPFASDAVAPDAGAAGVIAGLLDQNTGASFVVKTDAGLPAPAIQDDRTGAPVGEHWLAFTVTPPAGRALRPAALAFDMRPRATAAARFAVTARAALHDSASGSPEAITVAGAVAGSTGGWTTVRVPLAGLPDAPPGEPLEFRICVSWTTPLTPAPEHCVFECDNIVLTGAVEDITAPPPENTVTITFDPNGGALGAQPAAKEVTRGETYGALPVPTRANHAFRGWWTTAAGTGAQIVAGDTVPADAAAQTLHAKWEVTGSADDAAGAAALANNTPQTNISGALDTFDYYKINIPAGAVNLIITTTGGTGDCNLYIKPPAAAGYELAGDEEGNNEIITIADPAPGEWNIFLHAYEPYSGVTLTAAYTPGAGTGGNNDTGGGGTGTGGGGGGGGAPGVFFIIALALLATPRLRAGFIQMRSCATPLGLLFIGRRRQGRLASSPTLPFAVRTPLAFPAPGATQSGVTPRHRCGRLGIRGTGANGQ